MNVQKLWGKTKGHLVQVLQYKLFNLSYQNLRSFKMSVKLNQLIESTNYTLKILPLNKVGYVIDSGIFTVFPVNHFGVF